MTDPIHLSAPDVGATEERALVAALRSGWVAPTGPEVDLFEREMADRIGVPHAVALSSGTAALHLGLITLGIGPGDVVVTATMTFAATVNALCYVGAQPVLVDCDPTTGNLDPTLLDEALGVLSKEGRPARLVVPVDLLGKAADYTALLPIAQRYDVPLLVDAAESVGASHAGRPAGSFGAASVLSFNGNKIITTSGGGMLLTSDEEVARRVRHLATQARQPTVAYEHVEVGFNYRLSNLLAAVGRAQLARLDSLMRRRREIRERYRGLVADVGGVSIFGGAADTADNCWLTALILDPAAAPVGPDELRLALAAERIEARPLWKPMHLQPVFAGARAFLTGAAQRLFETGLTLPSGSGMTDVQLDRVIDVLQRELGTP